MRLLTACSPEKSAGWVKPALFQVGERKDRLLHELEGLQRQEEPDRVPQAAETDQ